MGFSKNDSSSESKQFVWPTQAGFLSNLYGMGQQVAEGQAGMGEQAQELLGGIMPQTQEAFNSLLNPNAGGMNPALQAYGDQVGQQFQDQILPSISRGAQGVGQLGGGRQGVAEGVAAGMANQSMQNFAGEQYNQDRNRMLQGIGQAGGLFNLGMAPSMAEWMPLQNYSGILGSPTVIGKSEGGSSGFGFNI